MNCPSCLEQGSDTTMDAGHLYVRGIFSGIHWGDRDDVGAMSRSGLTQIDLGEVSTVPTGAQAVVPAVKCSECGFVGFQSGLS